MHSVSESSDLTSRARLRDAAIELFAERGFDKTSVKAIAEAAGVSPGLVIHHYGSKDELRRVCDEHVIAKLLDERFSSAEAPSPNLVQALLVHNVITNDVRIQAAQIYHLVQKGRYSLISPKNILARSLA